MRRRSRRSRQEKRALTNHFLADGIEETAVVFEFLPDCVANAVKNPVVTLTGLLEILEEPLGRAVWRSVLCPVSDRPLAG